MTQDELAAAAGLSRTFISQIERGRFSATLETVGALSEGLKLAPAKLLHVARISNIEKAASHDI